MDIINQLLLHQGVSYLDRTRGEKGIMKSLLPGREQSNIVKIGILTPSSIAELQETDPLTPQLPRSTRVTLLRNPSPT